MRLLASLLLGYTLLVSGPPVWAGLDEPETAPSDYDQALAPYGDWVDQPTYGRVWHPVVVAGWQPYVDGSWAWTPYGWTWVSYEPWAWTFHYGRWAVVPGVGWCWAPGYVWGPAWVDWYWGDGFVGWAPLPPFATHVAVINRFVFVHDRDFCAPHLRRVFIRHDRIPHDVVRRWRWHDQRPPAIHQIERVARHRVVRFEGRPPDTVVPRPRPVVHDAQPLKHDERRSAGRPLAPRSVDRHAPPPVVLRPSPRDGDAGLRRPPAGVVMTPPGGREHPTVRLGRRGADPITAPRFAGSRVPEPPAHGVVTLPAGPRGGMVPSGGDHFVPTGEAPRPDGMRGTARVFERGDARARVRLERFRLAR